MNHRETITAVIPAKNEEQNIERCVKSVLWCEKIVVLWMGNDKTKEIAEKIGAEVIELNKSEKDDFLAVQQNVNWAIDHCKTDWILRIDADEEVMPELKEEILNAVRTALFVAYGIPRKQYFWGGFLKGGDWAYDRLVRLFKPQNARYNLSNQVHEQFEVNGPIGYLKNSLLHYSHPTLNDARRKFQSYTDIQIRDLNDNSVTALIKLFLLPPYVFLRWMIWHRGYVDGIRGVVAGLYRAWYEYLLYSKYLKSKK